MELKRNLPWASLIIGIWLIISPWFAWYAASPGARWHDFIGGIVIGVLAYLGTRGMNWANGVNVVIGLWLIISGLWVLGPKALAIRWNQILTGILVGAISLWAALAKFELSARGFYAPKMMEILRAAGAQSTTLAPLDMPPMTRHVMGTLRMGNDPKNSVCDRSGKLHDLENLYCADGALFVTSSGYNPTSTIFALALWVAGHMVSPRNPYSILNQKR